MQAEPVLKTLRGERGLHIERIALLPKKNLRAFLQEKIGTQ